MAKDKDTSNKKLQRKKQKAFIAAYKECGNISRACDIAEITRTTHYRWLKEDDYRENFEKAGEVAVDRLEEEARRRAVLGVEEPVFHRGKQIATIKKYSDTLLIFLLKGARPQKYKDNAKVELVGKDGGPVEFENRSPREEIEGRINGYATRQRKKEDT